jgi:Zn-dependent peptidase ImmA (M78 family)
MGHTTHEVIIVYDVYKKARDKAWECLLECNVTSLPVKLSPIATHYGIQIKDNTNVNLLRDNQLGCVAKIDGELYAIIDRTVSIERQRYTIAHEIGHVALEHIFETPLLMREQSEFSFTALQEYQAERFAINLLSPACVLWGLDLHSPQDISLTCNISLKSAKKRAKRMKELYNRNKFLTSPLEQEVFAQFKGFIESN